jgi:cytochrome c biogenesis protein CcmG/thiol:disulfide interchange protein DsbE
MQKAAPETDPPPRSNRPFRLVPIVLFVALASVFALALRTGDPSRLPSALLGKPAPALTLPALDGLVDGTRPVSGITPANLATGKPVIVNFWASWCAPCVEEHPLLVTLKEKHGADIIGINYKDQAPAARRFLGRYGNPFAAVGTDNDGRAAIEWGVYGMPETFVLNGRGQITFKHVGPLTPQSLNAKLLPALKAAATQ